jgi:hypothetical protein
VFGKTPMIHDGTHVTDARYHRSVEEFCGSMSVAATWRGIGTCSQGTVSNTKQSVAQPFLACDTGYRQPADQKRGFKTKRDAQIFANDVKVKCFPSTGLLTRSRPPITGTLESARRIHVKNQVGLGERGRCRCAGRRSMNRGRERQGCWGHDGAARPGCAVGDSLRSSEEQAANR